MAGFFKNQNYCNYLLNVCLKSLYPHYKRKRKEKKREKEKKKEKENVPRTLIPLSFTHKILYGQCMGGSLGSILDEPEVSIVYTVNCLL